MQYYVPPNVPRLCSKKAHRQSVPSDSNRADGFERY